METGAAGSKARTVSIVLYAPPPPGFQDLRFRVLLSPDVICDGHVGLSVDAGVSRLVEGQDSNPEPGVLPHQLEGLLVGVEGVHEDERNVGVVAFVQPFDLEVEMPSSVKLLKPIQ